MKTPDKQWSAEKDKDRNKAERDKMNKERASSSRAKRRPASSRAAGIPDRTSSRAAWAASRRSDATATMIRTATGSADRSEPSARPDCSGRPDCERAAAAQLHCVVTLT